MLVLLGLFGVEKKSESRNVKELHEAPKTVVKNDAIDQNTQVKCNSPLEIATKILLMIRSTFRCSKVSTVSLEINESCDLQEQQLHNW